MSGLLGSGNPGCRTTVRIPTRRKEAARVHANSPYPKTAKPELSTMQLVDHVGGGGRGSGIAIFYPGGRMLTAYGDRVGFAVSGAWLTLWLSGRWRPERTWIDRLGRVMGWLW